MKLRFMAVLLAKTSFIAGYLIMGATFISAYFSPFKIVTVHINNWGEANIELLFFLLTFPCVIYYITSLRWRDNKMWVEVNE